MSGEELTEASAMEALLGENSGAVRHMMRAANASAGRDVGNNASASKKRKAPTTEDSPSSVEGGSSTKVARFSGTLQSGWGEIFGTGGAAATTTATTATATATAPSKTKSNPHAELAQGWDQVCTWCSNAVNAARKVDGAIMLARAFEKQEQVSEGGGSSSASASKSISQADVMGAWSLATKGANSRAAFPGVLRLAARKTHGEHKSTVPPVSIFKNSEQPVAFKCDTCEDDLGCTHHVWSCTTCNTLYRVSRGGAMVGHFTKKEHLDNLDAAVALQESASADAPPAAVTRHIRGDFSALPKAVVRQVCISEAQSGQTRESAARTLQLCAKVATTIRGTEDAGTLNTELATMRKHGCYASVDVVQRAVALSAKVRVNAESPSHVLTRTPHNTGRAVKACAKKAKESKCEIVSECEVVSASIDETTPPSAMSKPVFCCLYACSFAFLWCCTFWSTENIANSTGEQYLQKLEATYKPFWAKLKAWGIDGCHSMRSTFAYAGVDGHDGEGKSFLSRLQNVRRGNGLGKTHGYHSILHWVQLAISDGVKAAMPPEWRKHAGKLGSHFGRSAERKGSFNGLRKAVVDALNVLVDTMAGMAGKVALAASVRKYVPTRWLSLRRYTQSVMVNWTALWALKQQMVADGWGMPEPAPAADVEEEEEEEDEEGGADAGGDGGGTAALGGASAASTAMGPSYKVPTAAELVAACGGGAVGVGPSGKRSWIMDPVLGINDMTIGLDALMDSMLAPWAKLQTDLQTTKMPIQHLVCSMLQNAVNVTEANWAGAGSFSGAYSEWRSMMDVVEEDKSSLVELLDSIGVALAKAIAASFKVRAEPYMPYYRAFQLIDPLGPAIGKGGEDAGEDTWAAVNTICETYDNLDIDPKELRAAILGERQKVRTNMLSEVDLECIKGNLLAYYRSKAGDSSIPFVLKKFAAVVFGTPIETVIVESFFSTYQMGKTGRRASTADGTVADGLHLRGVASATGDVNEPFLAEPNCEFDPSAAWAVRMPWLRELTNITRVEFNVPVNPGTEFRCYAEEWETVKDKRTRLSKDVREKSIAKYTGMFLYDEDDAEHPKRVIKQMVWHANRSATAAGWTVDTLDANSQDSREKYHVLKADGKGKNTKLVDGDVFADIKKACKMGLNKHRTIIYEPGEEEEEEEEEEDDDY